MRCAPGCLRPAWWLPTLASALAVAVLVATPPAPAAAAAGSLWRHGPGVAAAGTAQRPATAVHYFNPMDPAVASLLPPARAPHKTPGGPRSPPGALRPPVRPFMQTAGALLAAAVGSGLGLLIHGARRRKDREEKKVVNAERVHCLKGHTAGVNCVACSPVGPLCASASWDRTIRVWDIETGELVHVLTGHTEAVWTVAFSPKGGRIASGSWDFTVRVWDTATGKLGLTLEGHTDIVYSVAFTPDGLCIVSCSKDKTVRVWDARTGRLLQTMDGRLAVLRAESQPRYAPDGPTIRLRNPDVGPLVRRVVPDPNNGVNGVAIAPDGARLFGAGADGAVKVWALPSGEMVGTLHGHPRKPVHSVAVSPDGRWLLSGGSDIFSRLWDAASGEPVAVLGHNRNKLFTVVFSPDGVLAAGAGLDPAVQIWSVEKWRRVAVCDEGPEEPSHTVAFSHDGRHLVSGSMDTTVNVWDVSAAYAVARDIAPKWQNPALLQPSPAPTGPPRNESPDPWPMGWDRTVFTDRWPKEHDPPPDSDSD